MDENETTFTIASEADLFADADVQEEGRLTHGRPSRKLRGIGDTLSRSVRRRSAAVAPHQTQEELFGNSYGTFHPGGSEMSRLSSDDEQVMTVESQRIQHRRSFGKQMQLRYNRLRDQVNDALSFFRVSKSMECFGGGVYSYFSFVMWLGRVNFFTVLLYLGAVILPYAIIEPGLTFEGNLSKNNLSGVPATKEKSDLFEYVRRCSAEYQANLTSYVQKRSSPIDVMLDVLQGSGQLERFRFLFIGQYFDKVIYRPFRIDFNTSLGLYLCLWLTLFFVLLLIMISSGRSLLESRTTHADARYTFKVLSRWDFVLRNRRRAKVEKTNVCNELKHQVDEDDRQRQKQKMSSGQRRRLTGKRAVVWTIYIVMSGAALTGIFFVLQKSQEETARLSTSQDNSKDFLLLLFQYLPSLYIVITNFLIELYCNFAVKFEEYGANTQISLTIKRTIFLRFVSVVVLMVSMFQQLNNCNISDTGTDLKDKPCVSTDEKCGGLRCWETYVGQQIYKLVFLDIILFLGISVLDLLRKFVCRFVKFDVSTEFNISMNVIDLIYTQTLGWLGMFFCPLLPIAVFVKIVAIYFFKKFCVRYNIYKHNPNNFNAEQTESYFLPLVIVLILIVIMPLGVATSLFSPSRGCSPYRLYVPATSTGAQGGPRNSLDNALRIAFDRLGSDVEQVFATLDSYVVVALIWIILLLIIYYYITLSQARDNLTKHLEMQMVNEMQDQAFQQKRALESLKALRIAQAAQRRT